MHNLHLTLNIQTIETPLLKPTNWDFPGGSVVKTQLSQYRGHRFSPQSGNQIPHATAKEAIITTWCSQINIKKEIASAASTVLKNNNKTPQNKAKRKKNKKSNMGWF